MDTALLVIQTILQLGILVVFWKIYQTLSCQIRMLTERIECIERDVKPVLDETRTTLESVNKLLGTAYRGVDAVTTTIEKVKNASVAVEALILNAKNQFESTFGKLSAWKYGFRQGIIALAEFYMNKKKKEAES